MATWSEALGMAGNIALPLIAYRRVIITEGKMDGKCIGKTLLVVFLSYTNIYLFLLQSLLL
jgi:hypothetical protein